MRRRAFITLLGGAAAWPLAARAQQRERMRQIAVLIFYSKHDWQGQMRVAALKDELKKFGWEEGRNCRIDYHWYEGDVQKARAAVAQLVELGPDVIVANGLAGVVSLQQATRTIPIVFVLVGEPVARGLVQSLAHPGGNITGFTNLEWTTAGKWVELMQEIAPAVKQVAVIFNPVSAPFAELFFRSAEEAARKLAIGSLAAVVHSPAEIEAQIKAVAQAPDAGLIVIPDGFTQTHRKLVIELAARHRLPAVYPFRFYPDDGGLISYGIDPVGAFRQTATYVDRILRGEKPANLPVQQPTKFELVINLKTAKALGLAVPPMLLARADEVIE
jgi:putative ABC transport system substrate-binding protein